MRQRYRNQLTVAVENEIVEDGKNKLQTALQNNFAQKYFPACLL